MWKLLKNQNGMTLMEVVVGIAIIGIASVMLVTGFGFIGRMLQHSNSVKNASNDLSTMLEDQVQGQMVPMKETIKIDGKIKEDTSAAVITLDGSVHTFSQEADGTTVEFRAYINDPHHRYE
ncbi:pilus assembly FimT family protein [Eubacterium limosum]|uniref:pilus assembly FimT family protein n=1 Tax=Eubacterium limosum TaxID=1736 RepID=UPI001062A3E5|nr:type II secretion system protein [Eubacterium limosum]